MHRLLVLTRMTSENALPYKYINFPVEETIEVRDIFDINIAVNRMVELYMLDTQNGKDNFSCRILLPRSNGDGREESIRKEAKKIGLKLQIEFVLALKQKKLKPNIREVRYVHDSTHYGWILASPQLLNG
jgi:hypothetical protein